LDLIREQVPPRTFKTWFEPVCPIKLEGDILTIQVGSSYVYEYIEEHFVEILRDALKATIGKNAKLQYSVVMANNPNVKTTATISSAAVEKPTSAIVALDKRNAGLKNPFHSVNHTVEIDSQLNTAYTMDNFIEGSCNRLAKSAGMTIAKNSGKTSFNPFLIYGGSGLGKTHLAQAIGLEVKRNTPSKAVLYVSVNLFQTQFTEAVRRNEINDFLHFYQLIDVLILDDIHELAGKTATQNTFFHIFNHLQQSGKQLILTCDKPPVELTGIEDRLLSRFKWGLSAEIKSPEFETKKEIVISKARRDGIDFPEDVVNYLCKNVQNNVRELEGTMISLLAQSTFNKKDITLELAKDILGKTVKNRSKELTVDKIQNVVCEYFHISPAELQTKTRKREIVQARYLAMYFCKNYTKASLTFIGNQIGKKDHTTVLYACKVVSDLVDTDRKFKAHFEELQKMLYINV
jgi:chromosomal replication initiator protein